MKFPGMANGKALHTECTELLWHGTRGVPNRGVHRETRQPLRYRRANERAW